MSLPVSPSPKWSNVLHLHGWLENWPCFVWFTSAQKKLCFLPVRAPSVQSNIVFKPASHRVGHQKDGVITEATDGQCVRSGITGGWPRSKFNTKAHIYYTYDFSEAIANAVKLQNPYQVQTVCALWSLTCSKIYKMRNTVLVLKKVH